MISRVANALVAARMNLRRLPRGWRRDGKIQTNLSDKGLEQSAARIAIIGANVTHEIALYRVFISRVAQFSCETIQVGGSLQDGVNQPAAVGRIKPHLQ